MGWLAVCERLCSVVTVVDAFLTTTALLASSAEQQSVDLLEMLRNKSRKYDETIS